VVLLVPGMAFGDAVTLDGAGGPGGRTLHDVGRASAAATYNGVLHLFYHDATGGDLRWGRQVGDTWTFRTIDGAGGLNGRVRAYVGEDQAALVYGGTLHVFYYDRTHGDLRHGSYDGDVWSFETLDGAGGMQGRVDARVGLRLSATRFGGDLHLIYVSTSGGDVRHAAYNGTGWSFETLDGAGGSAGRIDANVGWNTAVAVFGSKLHVFYFHQDPGCDPSCHVFGAIREATYTGTAWTFAHLASINCCHVDQSLAPAKIARNNVYLFYENYGYTTQNLRAQRWNGTSWVNEGCVGEPFIQDDQVGALASAAVIAGRPHVTYLDGFSSTFGQGGIAHTFFNGTRWRTSMIGVDYGGPLTSIDDGGLTVFIGEATINFDGAYTNDLVLATPVNTGIRIPADHTCVSGLAGAQYRDAG
jgi:hypothetical protein